MPGHCRFLSLDVLETGQFGVIAPAVINNYKQVQRISLSIDAFVGQCSFKNGTCPVVWTSIVPFKRPFEKK